MRPGGKRRSFVRSARSAEPTNSARPQPAKEVAHPVGRALGLGRQHLATADLGAWAQPQPRTEMLDGGDHATTQDTMAPLAAVLLGVSDTDLLRRSHVIATSRTHPRGRAGQLHEALNSTSAPAFGQLSWTVGGRLATRCCPSILGIQRAQPIDYHAQTAWRCIEGVWFVPHSSGPT